MSSKSHAQAEILRKIRLQKRLTQAEVSSSLKWSRSYYSQVERGEKPTELDSAIERVNEMRKRTNRTEGGENKTGRIIE